MQTIIDFVNIQWNIEAVKIFSFKSGGDNKVLIKRKV